MTDFSPNLTALAPCSRRASFIKTASPAFQSILNEIRPDELDDARVVVAVCEIVIQSRKTVPLTGFLHASQLFAIKLRMIDASPVTR